MTVAGGHLASAAEGDLCIDAIQGTDTAGWDLTKWDQFINGIPEGDEVIGGCLGDFGVGKLVINVIDKDTGLPVDGTVDLTKVLNAFQFGYEGYAYGSPEASRLDPYCDLRWGTEEEEGFDQFIARIGADDEIEPPDAEFRLDETGFGGRPLRFLHWVGGVDDPVSPIGLEAELQPHQIAFSWACDANYETLMTPAIADIGGGYELLAGSNTGRLADDGTSDFNTLDGGTPDGLQLGEDQGWQQIDLYVSKRAVVEETTTTSTTSTTTTTTVAPPPTTQPPAAVAPGPPASVLPETGRESGPLAAIAALVLGLGAAAIGISRRRPASR